MTSNRRSILRAESTPASVRERRPTRVGPTGVSIRHGLAILLLIALSASIVAGCRSARRGRGSTDVAVLEPSIPTPEPVAAATPVATPTPIAVESSGLEIADLAFD